MSDHERGLYQKYHVERVDGSSGPGGKHEHCPIYVLDIVHDKFAFQALAVYAEACESEYPMLAADIRKLLERAAQQVEG
jgi:hypothetical protein